MKKPEHTNIEKTRVLIVDDHPLIRESLKCLILKESDLEVCGEAENRKEAMSILAATQPQLILLDLSLPDSHGTEMIKDLRDQLPDVFILVLSALDELVYSERVVRAGAHGFLTKQEALSKVLGAIRCVLSGEIYWTEKTAARVASKFTRHPRASAHWTIDSLTDREIQVLERIGMGQDTRLIATTLHIDASTVETYRSRIKEKLNLNSGSELLQFAIRWRWNGKTND